MGGLLDNLGALVLQYPEWSHWIIAVSILIQGEVTVLVGVFLVANHSLSWGDFLIPAIGSLIVGDMFIFFFGRLIRNTRFGWKFYRKIKHSRRTQFYFHYVRENINKLMIISKFLVAANIFAVLAISWSKVSFARFMKSQFISIFLWFFSATAITYFLATGFTYLRSEKIFRQIEIGILVIIVLMFIGEHFLRKRLSKKFFKEDIGETDDVSEEEFRKKGWRE